MRQADSVSDRIDETGMCRRRFGLCTIGIRGGPGIRSSASDTSAGRKGRNAYCRGTTMTGFPNDRTTSSSCFDGLLKKRIEFQPTNDGSASDADAPQRLGAQQSPNCGAGHSEIVGGFFNVEYAGQHGKLRSWHSMRPYQTGTAYAKAWGL
jgi:hypothetical protein